MTVKTVAKGKPCRITLHRQSCPQFQFMLPDGGAWFDAPWCIQSVSEMRAFMFGKLGGTYRCRIRRIESHSESYTL